MGIASSKNNSESLNWDKINTESMSATVPHLNTINKDAQKLVSNLNIDNNIDLENTESENENIFTWIRKLDGSNTNNLNENQIVNDNESDGFSDTSPFISSDMYKYLMNNNSSETSAQTGNQVGGAKDSSTSSTSSSEKKKSKKSTKRRYTESSEALSGGNLSYISSSAHTEHNSSEEYEQTSVSNSDKNNMLTTSVNTSDINLISED